MARANGQHEILCTSQATMPSAASPLLIASCLLGIGGIGILDYATAPDIRFIPFYLIFVGLAAWRSSMASGLVVAVCAAATWLTADLMAGDHLRRAITYWNAAVCLMMFSTVSLLLSRVRALTESLKERVTEKSAALTAEITSHRQTRHALLESEEQFRALVEGVHDFAIFMLDAAGNISSWNKGAETLTGYPAGEILERPFFCLWPPERALKEVASEAIAETLRVGTFQAEGWRIRRDGSRFWAATILTPLCNGSGEVYGFSKVVHDVGIRKYLQDELLSKEEHERRRIGRELHDVLGQDLTAIALLSKQLQENLASDAGSPHAAAASRLSRLASQLISQTRHLARGLCPLKVEAGDLTTALEELAITTEDRFGVRCQLHCSGPVLVHNPTTALHLYRIAQEAITNAVKHGKASAVRLVLSAKDGHCTLRIEDDGAGLPHDVEKRQGLGIPIIKYRVQAVDGHLKLDRLQPRGTAVICSVPVGGGAILHVSHERMARCNG